MRRSSALLRLVLAALLAGLATAAHAADESQGWWKAAREKAGRYPIRTRLLHESGRPRHVNALILERSPYLLQHAHDLHRLARQTGTSRYRDALASVATHLRRAVDVDASDQTTLARVLYEIERPAPVRKAFLADGHVQAEITRVAGAGDKRELDVTIRIDPGWHVNGHRPRQEQLIATRIDGAGGAAVDVTYPPAKDVVLGVVGGPVAVYEGTVTLGVRLAAPNPAVTLSLQACNDRICLLPETVRLFR